jgi:hypothetical protein
MNLKGVKRCRQGLGIHGRCWQLALIAAQHFAQDRTAFVPWMMRAKGSAAFAQPPCGPWSVIMTDNILHVLFMAGVAAL